MTTLNKTIDRTKKPVSKDWHRAQIICALRLIGNSVQRLSRLNGYHPHALNLTLGRPWPKGERIIAEALGVAPQTIWPSRYNTDGTPKSGRGERGRVNSEVKHTPACTGVNDQLKQAA